MTKFVIAGNISQEFKDKLAARVAQDVAGARLCRWRAKPRIHKRTRSNG